MQKEVVITGGAGFIGVNLAERHIRAGNRVTVVDDLSRPGSAGNNHWLERIGGDFEFIHQALEFSYHPEFIERLRTADVIFHLAAQTAVTTSVTNPHTDFQSNAVSTFNLLEAIRIHAERNPVVIYASTNKVYGDLAGIQTVEKKTRHDFKNRRGIDETQPVVPHTPYGVSKAAAEHYMVDYSKTYGLRTVVFRQSCIYGPRQLGVEDQGWVAWFTIALTKALPLMIYGDGKQVRDLLHVRDLISAYNLAAESGSENRGQVYNIGGGRENSVSVWHELSPLLRKHFGHEVSAQFSEWRPGDQKVFISDNTKAKKMLGWEPRITVQEGIKELVEWVQDNANLWSVEDGKLIQPI